MDILTANQDTTTRFAVTIEEINAKYKKEKEDLKRIIAETARSQAEQILANDDDDSMGDPKEMLSELLPLRLQYNSIVVKQKKELDIAMDRYNVEIWNNMGNKKITTRTEHTQSKAIKAQNEDDKIRLEVFDKYIGPTVSIKQWSKWHPGENFFDHCKRPSADAGKESLWFRAFRNVIDREMKRAQQRAQQSVEHPREMKKVELIIVEQSVEHPRKKKVKR